MIHLQPFQRYSIHRIFQKHNCIGKQTDDSLYNKKGDLEFEDMEEKRIYTKDVEVNIQTDDDRVYEYVEVWSVKGAEHAKKVALDKYYEILAEKEGVK